MGVERQAASSPGSGAEITGSLLLEVCLPFLETTQNPDGGWGYRAGRQSGVEPTCWAIWALAAAPNRDNFIAALERAVQWLRGAQLADGSWPALTSQMTGCWVTALACRALHSQDQSADACARVGRGLAWLCNTRPGEARLWWRLQNRLYESRSKVRQDASLVGWSWTPGTASWVEPTSHSLILFDNTPRTLHPPRALKRREMGERMLYDRMCPGGGWNSGNPLVYGVAGEPRVIPTVWALLALRRYPERKENAQSLDWLERSYPQIQGPASLALAHLCRTAYGWPAPPLEPDLRRLYQRNGFFQDTLVTSYAAVALEPQPAWAAVGAGTKE